MKRAFLAGLLVVSGAAFAQEPPVTKPWEHAGFYSLTLSNSTFSNWAAGGNNAFAFTGIVRERAIRTSERWRWFNLIEGNFGMSYQNGLRIKTDDKIEVTTRIDRILKKNWSISLQGNFRSQFADGFSKPEDTVIISTWMAPGYLTVGLGATYKPGNHLSIYISPLTNKNTFVLDQRLADQGEFGVTAAVRDINGNIITPGANYRFEAGAFLEAIYLQKIIENVSYAGKLNLFSNYLDRPENIDVNFENLITINVYKILKVSFLFHLIYDNDINVINPDPVSGLFRSPAVQFKTVTGVSLAYTFGKWD
jgi:hypothetical protein